MDTKTARDVRPRRDSHFKQGSDDGNNIQTRPAESSARSTSNTQRLGKETLSESLQLYDLPETAFEPCSTSQERARLHWAGAIRWGSGDQDASDDPNFCLSEQFVFVVALMMFRREQDQFTNVHDELPASLWHMLAELLPGRNKFECLSHYMIYGVDGRFAHKPLVKGALTKKQTRGGRAVSTRLEDRNTTSSSSAEKKLPEVDPLAPAALHAAQLTDQLGPAECQRLLEFMFPDKNRDGNQHTVSLAYPNTHDLEPEARRWLEKEHDQALQWIRSAHFLPLLYIWYTGVVDDELMHADLVDFLGPENGPWPDQVDTVTHWIWKITESNQSRQELCTELDQEPYGDVIEFCAEHVVSIINANRRKFTGTKQPAVNCLLEVDEAARPNLVTNILFMAWNGARGNDDAFWTPLLNSPLAKVQEYSDRRSLQQFYRLPPRPAATLKPAQQQQQQ
ncbi:hypothetical protein Slin15195_G025460 [Septoria linicola]|uniref:Uncharacterized protein n=1 Tax=Septoria linicola TaxID=215465 RepID=A0A9Q9ANG8_9PEZI|nr:hypothetical protein Slin15195_G025460 [Septoria linicola]